MDLMPPSNLDEMSGSCAIPPNPASGSLWAMLEDSLVRSERAYQQNIYLSDWQRTRIEDKLQHLDVSTDLHPTPPRPPAFPSPEAVSFNDLYFTLTAR